MADGSIRIPVDVDIDAAENDLDKLKDAAERAAEEIARASAHIAEAAVPTTSKGWGREFQKTLSDMAKTGAAADEAVKAGDLEAADRLGQLYDDQERKLAAIAQHLNETVMLEQQRAAAAEQAKEDKETAKQAAQAGKEKAQAEKDAAREAEKLRKEQEKAAAASRKHGADIKSAIGGQIKNVIGKIGMMGVALMGVGSAMQIVRNAIADVKSENEYVSGQLAGFRNIIATAIEPIVVQVVHWLSVALSYLNAFIAGLTGVDLIANANAKAIDKQAKATAGAAKAAAQLAGFDEMNKLSDNSGGGGGGGAASGVFQLEEIDTSKVTEWVERIKQIIADSGIADKIREIFDKIQSMDFTAFLDTIKRVFEGLAVDAIVNALDIFGDVLDIMIAAANGDVEGVINAISMLLFDLLTGPIRPLLAIIDALFGTNTLEGYKNFRKWLQETNGGMTVLVDWLKKAWEWAKGIFDSVVQWAGEMISKIATAASEIWSKINEKIVQPVVNWITGIWSNYIQPIISKLWEIISTLGQIFAAICIAFWKYVITPIGEALGKAGVWLWQHVIKPVVDWIVWLWGEFKRVILDPLIDAFSKAGHWVYEHVIKPVFEWLKWLYNAAIDFFKQVGAVVVNFISNAFKAAINGVLWAVENGINGFIRLLNGAVDLINKIPGVSISRVSEIYLPRLAAGGIVNNPGRGVPLVAGEAGREAVLPLDNNTEWMDALAERINGGANGRPLQIQLNINGRRLQEFLIDLGARRAFATNGGAV